MSDSPRSPLPFEPNKKPKKKADRNATASQSKDDTPKKPAAAASTKRKRLSAEDIDIQPKPRKRAATRSAAQSDKIPDEVNRRMLARMGAFSGTPSILGVLVLVGSYFTITKEWFPLPSVAVLLASMGCFGLGVVGLTYGALSASWDPGDKGTLLGLKEFKINLARLQQEWRAEKAEKQRQQEK